MKSVLTLLLAFPLFVQAQVDTVAVQQVVDSLIKISAAYADSLKFDKALEISMAAEKLALEKVGTETAIFGNVCMNYGKIFSAKRNFAEAEKWYLESKRIREKVLTKEHPDYGSTLYNLAGLYLNQNRRLEAEGFFLEALDIFKKTVGNKDFKFAASLLGLGNLYRETQRYVEAESLFIEVIEILTVTVGKESKEYAQSLNNLGHLYLILNRFAEAEKLFLEAKSIREKVLGKKHWQYAESLNNLGVLYKNMGRYYETESFYFKAKDIREEVLGKRHPQYAESLNNLAALYVATGRYADAEKLYGEAIEIRKEVLGSQHPQYAESLNNLANLYKAMGQNGDAKRLLIEAKNIFEANGRKNPNFATSLANLAAVYEKLSQYDTAILMHIEAKNIREEIFGKQHSSYAVSLNNLGLLYWKTGDIEKAEAYIVEAKQIREMVLGKMHTDYATSIGHLAALFQATNRHGNAESLLQERFFIHMSHFIRAVTYLSEKELDSYAYLFKDEFASTLSFYHASTVGQIPAIAYDQSLFFKGFVLNAAIVLRQLAFKDSASTQIYNRINADKYSLTKEYAKPIAQRKGVEELEQKVNTLEKELSRTVAGYGDALRQVTWQEVQAALKSGEAAVEFVHYRFYTPKSTDSVMYAALVVRPGDVAPYFIPLFEEQALASKLTYAASNNVQRIEELYAPETGLFDLIWQPLKGLLKGVKTIYCSPSGLLHKINLVALPYVKNGKDNRQFILLSSTRFLVVPATTSQSYPPTAHLVGGVRYGTGGSDTLEYLEHTAREVEAIAHLLKNSGFEVHRDTGFAATEESILRIGQKSPSPRILHLATHGFFFPDPKTDKNEFGRLSDNEPAFRFSDNPMLRSGLLLANSQQAYSTGKMPDDREDGILTAYEVSQMNLNNTELVVLPACETALGGIVANEGVFGLQRAFKIAGAKYLIMTLWQILDVRASEFMQEFYNQWLTMKHSIPDAFCKTQAIMRSRYPEQANIWAAFVLVE